MRQATRLNFSSFLVSREKKSILEKRKWFKLNSSTEQENLSVNTTKRSLNKTVYSILFSDNNNSFRFIW